MSNAVPGDLLACNEIRDRVAIGFDAGKGPVRLTGRIAERRPGGAYLIEDDAGAGWLVHPDALFLAGPA